MSHNILIDWGGTIIRDDYLFKLIAEKSNNNKDFFQSPDSWEKIEYIGNENYFKDIKNKFFNIGECYPLAEEVISSFTGTKQKSRTKTYINFDNKPNLNNNLENSLQKLSESIYDRNIDCNGIYINSDKINLCKILQVQIAIEDDPRIAISLALSGVKTILMMRKWNKEFNVKDLELTMKKEKFEYIKNNIFIAEDWFDTGYIIGNIVDENIV